LFEVWSRKPKKDIECEDTTEWEAAEMTCPASPEIHSFSNGVEQLPRSGEEPAWEDQTLRRNAQERAGT
jgi:hypothetical protein